MCVYVYINVYTYVFMHINIYTYIDVYIYICIYICRHTPAMHHSYAFIMPLLSMRHGAHLNESWHISE